jgi:putative spermidine/putrescine transport system permease protein
MRHHRLTKGGLWLWVWGVLVFLFAPIITIVIFGFDKSNIETWPIRHWSLNWYSVAFHDEQVRQAFVLSLKAACAATLLALVLGSLAAFGVHRARFFGRDTISLLLVLPIALPGIITGVALNSTFQWAGIELSIWTIIIGHTTFCIVVVYNNVIARLRRTSGTLFEASADLGASTQQTFRFVTFPLIATALISGGLLAFALSFDEVIVTTFTAGAQNTLPIWIFGAIRLGQQLPEVNVVVTEVVVLMFIPILIAARLTGRDALSTSRRSTSAPETL